MFRLPCSAVPRRSRLLPALLLAIGCGSGTDPDPPSACAGSFPIDLPVGGHEVIDPVVVGDCVTLPAGGSVEAEYLVVVLSANGDESASGASGSFALRVDPGAVAVDRPAAAIRAEGNGAARFHRLLRERERALAHTRPAFSVVSRATGTVVPPVEGTERTFKVCASTACDQFVDVPATARFVGARSAVYLDQTVPPGGYTEAEIDSLGQLFDAHLYPIDTVAFGRESDIDGNGVVAILLSDQVNALSANCASTGQVIVGYFFGLDLTAAPGSNQGEVFYSMVPDPTNALCFGKAFAQRLVGPTFIHEFQHMISYHRHVLLGGGAAEDTWLNEGLSQFAEELGGRQVPNGYCALNNCLNQFATNNLRNASLYLQSPVSAYLVEPGSSGGSLAERGANWLFLRWLADRAPDDSLLGTAVTRALLGADRPGGLTRTGAANVTAAAAVFDPTLAFGTLLGEWHLANYAESVDSLPDATGRLHYASWNLRAAIDVVQPGPYPLRPPSTQGQSLTRSGTLLGGSGDYLRVLQPAGGPVVTLRLTAGNRAVTQPRLAVLRLR